MEVCTIAVHVCVLVCVAWNYHVDNSIIGMSTIGGEVGRLAELISKLENKVSNVTLFLHDICV